MRPVMPRYFRPRLLLLPLVIGAVAAPAFLVSSAESPAPGAVHADSVCTNVAKPVENPRRGLSPGGHTAPTCANCRAPLLDAPLAQTDRDARPSLELPPAA